MTELVGLPYSPWSERARWALELRGVPYAFRTYAPLLEEPGLRLKLRKWSGTVSVPVLTDDEGRVLSDSVEIARWADGRGEGPELFPSAHREAIERFVTLSDAGLTAGRVLALMRVLQDDEALGEMVPKALRRALGPIALAMASLGVKRTLRKYGLHRVDRATAERRLTGVLDELRRALDAAPAGSDPKTLLGALTFADVTMAQVLAFVAPPTSGLRIGAASRRSFTDAVLRERYADLLSWRDALYAKHRGASASRGDAADVTA